MIQPQVIAIIGQRPTHTPAGNEIPADWPIFNATRPIYGTFSWEHFYEDILRSGWWATVDPTDPLFGRIVQNIFDQDARQVYWVSEEEAYQEGVAHLKATEPATGDNLKIDQLVEKKYVSRDWVIDRGLDAIEKQHTPEEEQ